MLSTRRGGSVEASRRVSVLLLTALGMLSLLGAGCSATPYQPMTLDGGYAQNRLGSDIFNVIFQGNAHTSWRTAETYALYRAAELSMESGFDYFAVVGGNSEISPAVLSGRETPLPKGTGTDSHPMVSLIIRGFSGEQPSEKVFNAREVIKALGPSIERK